MSTFERNVKGLLGTKLGMTQTWDENNRVVPVTVVAAGTNVITQVRTPETDGYNAIQVGFGEIEGRKVNSPAVVVRISTRCRRGMVPALWKWPARGLLTLRPSISPKPTWMAL